ncbi:hypothetical protein BIY26_09650 [Brenneria goodwinii]|uniref:Uncharacterized protein n=1 Tax=Brenneria goodwinii TaxID=1109412 RepID=A0AAE8JNI7_9GAMM|nr:hypothetical protein AWC36_07960 [Brenneria goodwinii]RLM19963.1 hypothetical protein BIY28_15250 [Brenneria goodwinii]RLM24922.1 hypothetical protein BIY26_09650 [Brenneria goodwinii]
MSKSIPAYRCLFCDLNLVFLMLTPFSIIVFENYYQFQSVLHLLHVAVKQRTVIFLFYWANKMRNKILHRSMDK